MEQVHQLHAQQNVRPESIVPQEVRHVQIVMLEHMQQMKDLHHVRHVEPENIVPPEVRHVVI